MLFRSHHVTVPLVQSVLNRDVKKCLIVKEPIINIMFYMKNIEKKMFSLPILVESLLLPLPAAGDVFTKIILSIDIYMSLHF